jgi:hypothetical protein
MKSKDLGERLSAARDAKQAMAAKFLNRQRGDDPAVVERREARAAVSAARDVRQAERAAKRLEDETRRSADAAAAAEQKALHDQRSAAEKVQKEAELELERKAARDARYAARKARK